MNRRDFASCPWPERQKQKLRNVLQMTGYRKAPSEHGAVVLATRTQAGADSIGCSRLGSERHNAEAWRLAREGRAFFDLPQTPLMIDRPRFDSRAVSRHDLSVAEFLAPGYGAFHGPLGQ
jgi:hypothetical protein